MGPELLQRGGGKGRVDRLGEAGVAAEGEVEAHQIQLTVLHGLHGLFKGLGQQHVIRVHKGDVTAFGRLDARVPGRCRALVGLSQHPHPLVLAGELGAQIGGAVGGTVVHQNQLEPGKALVQHTLHAFFKIFLPVVHGHDTAQYSRHKYVCLLGKKES